MNPRWLFRMARWARNPPSEGRVKLVFAIIGVCLLIFGIEYFVGWPELFSVDPKIHKWKP